MDQGDTDRAHKHVTQSTYLTLEALAASVVRVALEFDNLWTQFVTVRTSKPSALVCAEAPEVEITRSLQDGQLVPFAPVSQITQASLPTTLSTSRDARVPVADETSFDTVVKKAAIALGSNLGDRFANIEFALRVLETPGVHYNRLSAGAYVNVVDTSFMYETAPMYVSDQPKFINCACMVRPVCSIH